MHRRSVNELTSWLREQPDLVSARIAYLMRDKGVDIKTVVCAKIFPDIVNPTGGAVITPQGTVWQFAFNQRGMIMELTEIDEWVNITSTYTNHPWRNEILEGLAMLRPDFNLGG